LAVTSNKRDCTRDFSTINTPLNNSCNPLQPQRGETDRFGYRCSSLSTRLMHVQTREQSEYERGYKPAQSHKREDGVTWHDEGSRVEFTLNTSNSPYYLTEFAARHLSVVREYAT
jgi:hypothetical protein